MERTPQIGEGVRVPLASGEVVGEVVGIPSAGYVVVEIPIEGASGETLETVTIRRPIEGLRDLPRWKVVSTKQAAPSAGADADLAWYVDAARNGEDASVEVRVAGGLAARRNRGGRLPKESEQAFRTRGRSAVEKFAHRLRLPAVLVVGSSGVFELRR
jgi:hypothetical protein